MFISTGKMKIFRVFIAACAALLLFVSSLGGELEERQRMLDQDLFLDIEQKNTETAI